MVSATDLKVKIFADGADKQSMLAMYKNPLVKGFTTNPTLMRKAGISDYEAFARDILQSITNRSISFEVFADDLATMETQARKISTWGKNVAVKIPITNTRGESTADLCRRLSHDGIAINVTAIFTMAQVEETLAAVKGAASTFVSVFAGRIADSGIDPVPLMAKIVDKLKAAPNTELIWASPREVLNLIQADQIGCHIVTMTNDLINKLSLLGKNQEQYSLETVKMFYDDGLAAGYTL